jgi:hypothetical protein
MTGSGIAAFSILLTMRRLGLAGDDMPSSLEGFIDRHLGSDRQLTLRLA